MSTVDFNEIWAKALNRFLVSLEKPETKMQAERYFSQIRSYRLEGNECVITLSQPLLVDWLSNSFYQEGIESALCACGADPGIKVRFAASHEPPPEITHSENVSTPEPPKEQRRVSRHHAPSTIELDSNFTFDNFVRGPSNSFAHASALAVAKDPGRTYNPLFIWGGTGLGKTHLMQAIGHEAMKNIKGINVCYITSETLLNEYVNALQTSSLAQFRSKYRNTDILLIDDIQFIADKRQIQEEFFNTFNALFIAKKQIVITCDVAPRDLSGLESRLLSRFQGGMVIEIESPSYETRLAILKSKSKTLQTHIPDEALDFIAENIHSHVRALEGALKILCAVVKINPELELNKEQLRHILKDSIENEKAVKELSISEIQKTVGEHYGVTVQEILSADRSQSLVTPRQVAMFLARKLTVSSLPRVAESFGKSHATIHHGVKTIERRMEVEPNLRAAVYDLAAKLGRNPEELKS